MPKPFRTKEWKVKREAFLKGKVCAWCGATEHLSIHHKTKHTPLIKYVKLASNEMIAQKIKEGEFKPQYLGGISLTREDFKVFWAKYGEQINEDVKKRLAPLDEEYMSLTNCEALCKRCHWAAERGLMLCPVCKVHYMNPRHSKCQHCAMVIYKHPWCGREFNVDSRYNVYPSDFCEDCAFLLEKGYCEDCDKHANDE
jgi:hypothetical protein